MKASEVKTYEEIVEYIENNICDETADGINGLEAFRIYCADEDQEVIIKEWVKELWEHIIDDLIQEEIDDIYTFEKIPMLNKFVHYTMPMVKVLYGGVPVGINHKGEIIKVDLSEEVERA